MKKIILLLIFLIFADKAYCDYTITSTEYTPVNQPQYYQNYPAQPGQFYGSRNNNNNYNYNHNHRSFNNLERRILNQSYRNETQQQRLNRMEESMFGAVQSGDINTRYRALEKAMAKSRYQDAYYPQQKNGFWNNFLNSFSYSAGVPTGFTPPVTNGYYGDNFSPYGVQRSYYDNWGNYHNNAYNLQNGARIRILD